MAREKKARRITAGSAQSAIQPITTTTQLAGIVQRAAFLRDRSESTGDACFCASNRS